MVLEKPYLMSKRPLADWWFETESVSSIGIEEFARLLAMCEKCLSILASQRLLMPTDIILSNVWIYYNELGECADSITSQETNVEFPANGSKTLTELLLAHVLSKQPEKGFVYPAHFEVRGKGIIIDGFGNNVIVPDVTRIEARFMGGAVVDVSTRNYAWLPFSLSAEPQEEVYRNNAPRLENALREIEVALGVKGYAENHTEYCRINGYKLDNFGDEDGPFAVGELGGILES